MATAYSGIYKRNFSEENAELRITTNEKHQPILNKKPKSPLSLSSLYLCPNKTFLKRKSRKNAHFSTQIYIFASDKSERPLAIQNNVLSKYSAHFEIVTYTIYITSQSLMF